jgi:hypothetical protein
VSDATRGLVLARPANVHASQEPVAPRAGVRHEGHGQGEPPGLSGLRWSMARQPETPSRGAQRQPEAEADERRSDDQQADERRSVTKLPSILQILSPLLL